MKLHDILLALLVVSIWGFNFVVIEFGLQELPPLFLSFTRFFLSSIPLIFIVPFPKASFKYIALYGLIMFALQFALLFWGISAGVTLSLVSLLLQTQAIFTVLLAFIFFGEKLDRWQLAGGVLSFGGIGIIGMHIGGSMTLTGFLFVIAAAIAWAFGNLISKKMGQVNKTALVAWGSLIAWPCLLLLSFLFEGVDKILNSLTHLSWLMVGAIFFKAYFATIFAFGTWTLLIQKYSLPTVVPFTLLVPIFGMISSAFILHEALHPWKIIAVIVVLAGLAIQMVGAFWLAKRK